MTNNDDNAGSTKPRDVSLNVLRGPNQRKRPHSKMGKRRAAVLIFVHILIVAHIIQWLITGSTVSPVEPSESMETLEFGEVNAGFIFFVLAILATFVFGRFFCGWGCHVVALQDACTWMMNKMGVRPKPFRSRLLVWAPLIFGLYMFVWPTFKKVALFPVLMSVGIDPPIWLGGVAEFHGFSSAVIVEDFWATFPPWFVAIPFFLVVGFAAVYFLGSKGFCTYGCPYGGIFGVADQMSPGRIVVNDNCQHCGHCTAVCTSNVRVAEEVRDFGMVVDPGCMKCLDCVSACPNDALCFSFAKPAILTKPVDDAAKQRRDKIKSNPKRFDLTWPEEIALALVFIATFMAFRGMLNLVPMLMAAGMAGLGTFAAWKLWSLITKPNVRIQNLQLKAKGRVTRTGMSAGAISTLILLSATWSGWVNANRFRAHVAHERIDVPLQIVLRDVYVPTEETLARAKRGYESYRNTAAFSEGGFGWPLNAEQKRKMAFLALIVGDEAHATSLLRKVVEEGNPTESLVRQIAQLMRRQGASDSDILAFLQQHVESRETTSDLVPDIAMRLTNANNNDPSDAFTFFDKLIGTRVDNRSYRLQAAEFSIAAARWDLVQSYLSGVDEEEVDTVNDLILLARIRAKLRERERAIALLQRAAENENASAHQLGVVISLLSAVGAQELALSVGKDVAERYPESIALLQSVAAVEMSQGEADSGRARIQTAVSLAEESPWELLSIGESAVRFGLTLRDRATAEIGLQALMAARDLKPESPIIVHDLGQALLATGDLDAGLGLIRQASEMAPTNKPLEAAAERARQNVDRVRQGS
ncbi:MAG: 4Fe-4S binding protein [Phycisphaera sp.]|nr:MAG: 4Fe-4S binding protein [Phycisphaera sp.]